MSTDTCLTGLQTIMHLLCDIVDDMLVDVKSFINPIIIITLLLR